VWREFINAAATRRLCEFLDERQRRTYPVAGDVGVGNPSTEMVRQAGEWKADRLVLGTRGRWTGSPARLGSTVAAVLHAASRNAPGIPVSRGVLRHRAAYGISAHDAGARFPRTEEHAEAEVVLACGRGPIRC
jgi:hypothetical protein